MEIISPALEYETVLNESFSFNELVPYVLFYYSYSSAVVFTSHIYNKCDKHYLEQFYSNVVKSTQFTNVAWTRVRCFLSVSEFLI